MPYVQRDVNGNITGLFANPQEGYAEEWQDEAEIYISPDAAIKMQIDELESTITNRRMREAMLGTDNGWLANVNAQIAALRGKL